MSLIPVHDEERVPRLFFVFHGRQRPVRTLNGLPDPGFSIFEARAYPSLEYAMGETWEEAKQNLRKVIDLEIRHSGVSPEQWYAERLSELDENIRKQLHEAAFRAWTTPTGRDSINLAQTPTIVFNEVEDSKGCRQEVGCGVD